MRQLALSIGIVAFVALASATSADAHHGFNGRYDRAHPLYVEGAVTHLRRAVALDPGYSAAWKLLGKALSAAQRDDEALAAWHEGIAAAQRKGDKQAMREMQVFARRLAKQRPQE